MQKGTNTTFFTHPRKMPKGNKSACCKLVASIRPLKEEKNRTRVTIGGDRLEHEGSKSTAPATLTTVKIHLNSIVSTNKARCMTAEIKDFFCRTPTETCECGHLPLELIPKEIMQQHNLTKIAVNGKVHF